MGSSVSKGRLIDRRDKAGHFKKFYSLDTVISCVDDNRKIHQINVNKLNPRGKSDADQKQLDMVLSEYDTTVDLLKQGGLSGFDTCNVAGTPNDIDTPKKGRGTSRAVTPDRPEEGAPIMPTLSLDGIGTNATLRRCIPKDVFGMEEGHRVLIVCPCGPYNPTHYGLSTEGPHIHSRETSLLVKGGKYMQIHGVVLGGNEQGKQFLSDHTDKKELLKGFETRGDALVIQLLGCTGKTIEVKYKDIIDCTCEIWDVSANAASNRDFEKLFTYEADRNATPPSFLCTKRDQSKSRIAVARMLPVLKRIAKEVAGDRLAMLQLASAAKSLRDKYTTTAASTKADEAEDETSAKALKEWSKKLEEEIEGKAIPWAKAFDEQVSKAVLDAPKDGYMDPNESLFSVDEIITEFRSKCPIFLKISSTDACPTDSANGQKSMSSTNQLESVGKQALSAQDLRKENAKSST